MEPPHSVRCRSGAESKTGSPVASRPLLLKVRVRKPLLPEFPFPHLLAHVAEDGAPHLAQVAGELGHDLAPGLARHHAHLARARSSKLGRASGGHTSQGVMGTRRSVCLALAPARICGKVEATECGWREPRAHLTRAGTRSFQQQPAVRTWSSSPGELKECQLLSPSGTLTPSRVRTETSPSSTRMAASKICFPGPENCHDKTSPASFKGAWPRRRSPMSPQSATDIPQLRYTLLVNLGSAHENFSA